MSVDPRNDPDSPHFVPLYRVKFASPISFAPKPWGRIVNCDWWTHVRAPDEERAKLLAAKSSDAPVEHGGMTAEFLEPTERHNRIHYREH